MDDSDSDIEIAAEKTAEELLKEREAAAAARGDVLEVDDAEDENPVEDRKPVVDRKPVDRRFERAIPDA